MKLFASPTSPFARKVRVAVREKHMTARVDTVMLDPWASPDALLAHNPLSQVPTLLADNGLVLTNSDTIIDWLDRQYPDPALLPSDPEERDAARAVVALAQGLIECTVDIVIERRKPHERQDAGIIERRLETVTRTVGVLASRFDPPTDRLRMDAIGVACALAYLDLRLPESDWRTQSRELADWHTWASRQASMRDTAPPED